MEIVQRMGMPGAEHLQMALVAAPLPGFSSTDALVVCRDLSVLVPDEKAETPLSKTSF
jgi:hypothetical protein